MRSLRSLLFRRRMFFKGVFLLIAVAGFTVISLVSCSGITHPCVSCERELASDPYVDADDVRWEPKETKKRKKRDRERMRFYRERHNL